MFNFERRITTWMLSAHREDKYIGKAVIRPDINKHNYGGEGYADFRSHAAAVGIYAIYRTK